MHLGYRIPAGEGLGIAAPGESPSAVDGAVESCRVAEFSNRPGQLHEHGAAGPVGGELGSVLQVTHGTANVVDLAQFIAVDS